LSYSPIFLLCIILTKAALQLPASAGLSYSPIFLLCIILTKAALQLPASAGLSYSPIVYREVPYIDSKKKINRIFVFTKKHIT